MSKYFGFDPNSKGNYYFISYRDSDSGRVEEYAVKLHDLGVPLWYDYVLKEGSREWERQVVRRMNDSRGVIMFVTREAFRDKESYLCDEYYIARGFEEKKPICAVLLDDITAADVPANYQGWWADICGGRHLVRPTPYEIAEAISFRAQPLAAIPPKPERKALKPSAAASSSAADDGEESHLSVEQLSRRGEDYYYGFNGTKRDYAEAAKWFTLAAERGDVKSQKNLGLCYRWGEGIGKNYAEAAKWFSLAAEQGDEEAIDGLLELAKQGEKNAIDSLKKLAESGRTVAQLHLADCYKNGWCVARSYAETARYYRLAAEQGNAVAQYGLGWCYENGKGVKQDYTEAVKYFKLAAAQGNDSAKKALERIL